MHKDPTLTKTQATELFGSINKLAKALKITPQAIYQWPEEVPEPRASQIKLIAMHLGLLPAPEPKKRKRKGGGKHARSNTKPSHTMPSPAHRTPTEPHTRTEEAEAIAA